VSLTIYPFIRLSLGTNFLALTTVISLGASSRIEEITRPHETHWSRPPVRVDLKPYGEGCVPLEFSPDSQLLCAWWLPHPPIGDCNKLPGRAVIFDLQGKRIVEATDEQGELVGKYVSMFPDIAWRRRFADFVRDTDNTRISAWGFTADYSTGVRFVKAVRSDFALGTAELWRFSPPYSRLWSVTLPERVERNELDGEAWFFETDEKSYVLIAFKDMNGYILSREDGKLVDSFTYGKRSRKPKRSLENRNSNCCGPALIVLSTFLLRFLPLNHRNDC